MSDILTIKGKDLELLVNSCFLGIKQNITTDNDYAYIDLDWVEVEAYLGYERWLSIFNFGKGINNSDWKGNWDCEDLSNSFKCYLRLLHAQANPYTFTESFNGKAKNETNAESILVGSIFYRNSDRSAHCINLFFDKDNKPKFFEPMYGKFINLTEEQQRKVWYVNF